MMVDSDVWKDGLHYDERLMVDYTDTDWCFRARAAGWRLFVLPSVRMPHAISDAAPIRVMGLRLLRYSPLRRYYYFRNTVYFVASPTSAKPGGGGCWPAWSCGCSAMSSSTHIGLPVCA